MFEKFDLKTFLGCAILLSSTIILVSCGKPIQAAKQGSANGMGGSGNGGGGNMPFPTPTPTPPIGNNGVSCNLAAGTPTFTEVPLTLTVLGNVTQITIDNQPVALPPPGYTEVKVNYPITAAGSKTVTAFVFNAFGSSNNCSVTFVAPDLAEARKMSVPMDGGNFYIPANPILIADSNATTYRYIFAVSRLTGQAYYNSISLDPRYKPGQIDAWKGWSILPGQDNNVGAILSIVPAPPDSVVISVGAFGVGYFATVAKCKAGICSFSAWSEY